MVFGFVSKRCMTSFAIKNFYFCVASCFYITFARIYICSSTNNSNFFSFLAGWIILKSSLNSQRNGIMMMIFVQKSFFRRRRPCTWVVFCVYSDLAGNRKKMRVMGFLKKCGSFLDSPSFDRNFLSDIENCLKSQLTNFSQALAEHEGSNGNLIGNVDLRAV